MTEGQQHPAKSTAVFVLIVACTLATAVVHAQPAPTKGGPPAFNFTKTFSPDTIGPGSVSTLSFFIQNTSGTPAADIAFTDNLPAGVTIANPSATTDCPDAILSAPTGGTTIGMIESRLAVGAFCSVLVDVTSNAMPTSGSPITHMNVSGILTSNVGSGGPASDDLMVTADRPGFLKSFSPSTISPGQTSTLTLTIDNTANPSGVSTLNLTDNLPPGMVIASPAKATTDCGNPALPPTLIAVSGTSIVSLFANGLNPSFPALAAMSSCTITLDVTVATAGVLVNTTQDLVAGGLPSGKASAVLTVPLDFLAKSFLDDPVPPGGSVTLEFMITNFDRNFSANDLAFTDDLAATLAGLTYSSLLSNDCGGTVGGVGTTSVNFTGGTLAPETSCIIRVSLSVPPAAAAGSYLNTTNAITTTIDGSLVTGNIATDFLQVVPAPSITKQFMGDPVNPGDPVGLEFTLTNTSTTSSATDIAFEDIINTVLPTASMTPGNDCCGAGSTCTFTPLFNPSPPCNPCDAIPARVTISGGTLAPAGMAGDSCTFSFTLDVTGDAEPGTYPNSTSEISATVDGATRIGKGASDDLIIVAAPTLSKAFTDDPVTPGGTVTLEFTLELSPNSPTAATGITFTDDLTTLTPALTNLTANLPPSPDPPCGPGSTLTGSISDTLLTFAGGTLMPGESCTFSVTLNVPAAATSATYTNTTSEVGATVSGASATSAAASADLTVASLQVSKEFIGDPALPGDDVTLRFTIEKANPMDDVTSISFTDSLSSALSGLTAIAPLPTTPCGVGSLITGTTFLIFIGGNLGPGVANCVFDVTVRVHGSAADGTYANVTGNPTALVNAAGPVVFDPASGDLEVNSTLLSLIKAFTDDPVSPGDPVTLELTLTNLDTTRAASAVGFTDNLAAALAGLTFDSVLADTCAGTVVGTGTTLIDVSGVTLAAGASCLLRLSLTVPSGAPAGSYLNTTSTLTGTMPTTSGTATVTGAAASGLLEVIQLLDFSKSFDGPTAAGGTAIVTFTITNPGTETAEGLAFSDDLNNVISGLVATSLPAMPCGDGSAISGTSLLTFTGGELAPMGGTCSFDVEVTVPATATAGSFLNATSVLLQNGLKVSEPATANLVIEPPPDFDKAFMPSAVGLGFTSTLIFTIDNSASSLEASGLSFIDNLPAGLLVASTPNASTTCTDGTLTAVAGTGVVSYTGGTIGAAASCTIQVDVVTSATGFLSNTTEDLTSSSGNSGTAHATLAVDPQPGFSKSFSPNKIAIGGVSTLTFTIDNTAATVAATSLDFTDNLPTTVVVATPSGASTTCTGGTLTAASGSTVITYTGGSVAAFANCIIQVDVTSSTVGQHLNVSGALTSSLGNSGTASATLTVNPPPIFSKAFAPNPSIIDGVVTLTFTIDNTASTASATGLDFTDNLPAALLVATPANVMNDCTGGTVTATAGTGTISYTGGTVAASSNCTISVDITGSTAGMHVNTTGDLTSSLGNSGTAEATLTVNPPPGFAKAFVPASILVGDTGTLVFSINNTSSTADATDLDFLDNLPAEVAIADPAGATTDCAGGILTAVAGTTVVSYTGGTVPAAASCTISVDITSNVLGMHVNTSLELTSSLGNSGTAEATLTVEDLAPPTVTAVSTSAGPLAECDDVRSPIATLNVTIEDDRTPVLGADDPANYLLVGSGSDGDFSTADCTGGAAGDDVAIAVLSATLTGVDPLIANADLVVANENGLAAGLYRFFVCDSITDTAGNALDGNGDMTAGGDFEVPFFRADPFNLFANGHFDDCPTTLDPWMVTTTPPNTVQTSVPGTDDFANSPLSASAQITHSALEPSSLAQCVPVEGDVVYDLECWARFEPPMGALAVFVKTCEFFDAPVCGGASLGETSVASLLEDDGGAWTFSETLVQAPIGALSALCSFEVGPVTSDPLFDLYLDGIFFGSGNLGAIFSDGFESGNTAAWSLTVP